MDASVEAVDGDIVHTLKNILVEDRENEISAIDPHNFIYTFSDTVGDRHRLNRDKAVIDLSTGEVPTLPVTRNDVLLESDGKVECSMLYLLLNVMVGMGHKEPCKLL